AENLRKNHSIGKSSRLQPLEVVLSSSPFGFVPRFRAGRKPRGGSRRPGTEAGYAVHHLLSLPPRYADRILASGTIRAAASARRSPQRASYPAGETPERIGKRPRDRGKPV